MKSISLSLSWAMIFTLAFSAYTSAQNATKVNGPQISFDKETHDYGTIYVNGDGNCVFLFTNTGTEPLMLSDVKAGCGCTVPEWPREPVLPGKSAQIKVKYTTLSRAHQINKSIVVTSNSVEKSTVVLRIIGEVVEPPSEFSPEKMLDKAGSPTSK
ncbi:MAG: DUF1573 domain-containing protein [Bacteroidales bacterium]|nr:DUF1573 domain-containing protein [Bacteroidales bacterium]MDZ4205368.1 DUF1573 domain-containing protein [Bacteroidales bacterium]